MLEKEQHMHSMQCVTIISKCYNSCRKKALLYKNWVLRLARKGFWVDLSDRRFLGKCCFPPGTIVTLATKTRNGFPFWIVFQTKTITKYHFCNMMVMVGVTPWTLPSASQGIDTMQESRSILCACDVSSNPRSNCLFKGRRVVWYHGETYGQ